MKLKEYIKYKQALNYNNLEITKIDKEKYLGIEDDYDMLVQLASLALRLTV